MSCGGSAGASWDEYCAAVDSDPALESAIKAIAGVGNLNIAYGVLADAGDSAPIPSELADSFAVLDLQFRSGHVLSAEANDAANEIALSTERHC